MGVYALDRAWADQYNRAICGEVGRIFHAPCRVATWPEDVKRATDLVALASVGLAIGARVRRPGYLDYAHEFTIRLVRRNSENETEFPKILAGWCDYLFMAHADGRGGFACWMLVDLDVFRLHWWRAGFEHKRNRDGVTWLAAFDVRKFPAGLVVAERGLGLIEYLRIAA